jgi:hypothetical protein
VSGVTSGAQGVVLRPDGRLVASVETIERLKALCAQDAEELRAAEGPPPPQLVDAVVRVAAAPSDDAVEALLGSLLVESYVAASKSFELAREATRAGELIALRDAYVDQAARLTRASAEVAQALMRSRGKSERVIVQHIKGGQVVGVVNKSG